MIHGTSATTLKGRYEQLAMKRQTSLDRARRMAELSIPAIQPPAGWSGNGMLPEPYQGLGARGVINLSSRLLIALLPPGQKFFRLDVPASTLVQAGQDDVPIEITTGLAKIETMVQNEINHRGWRQPTNLVLQMLAVAGNACEYLGPDNRLAVYRLDQFVVVRDNAGDVIELIIEKKCHPAALPPAAAAVLPTNIDENDPHAEVCLYTRVHKVGEMQYHVHQEVEETPVKASEGVLPRNPFNVLRWNLVPGEDYGRGKVEDHVSDLYALEMNTKSMIEGAAMASRNITRISPSTTNARSLQRSWNEMPNGGSVIADPGELEMMAFGNVPGLQIVQNEIGRLTQELARSFLMTSNVRDAERVTATELRMMAEELEGTLGGVYSMLSEEMQLHRLQSVIANMQETGALAEFDDEMVEPTIMTGLEALGRERDVLKVTQALQLAPALPPKALRSWNFDEMAKILLTGLDLQSAVYTEEEMAEREAEMQAQQAAMAGMAGPQQ